MGGLGQDASQGRGKSTLQGHRFPRISVRSVFEERRESARFTECAVGTQSNARNAITEADDPRKRRRNLGIVGLRGRADGTTAEDCTVGRGRIASRLLEENHRMRSRGVRLACDRYFAKSLAALLYFRWLRSHCARAAALPSSQVRAPVTWDRAQNAYQGAKKAPWSGSNPFVLKPEATAPRSGHEIEVGLSYLLAAAFEAVGQSMVPLTHRRLAIDVDFGLHLRSRRRF